MFILIAISEHPQDDRAGRDATPSATEEHDGVNGTGQDESPLLHFHIEHYPSKLFH